MSEDLLRVENQYLVIVYHSDKALPRYCHPSGHVEVHASGRGLGVGQRPIRYVVHT